MLSRLVNTLIGIKPIYSVMKVAAKQVLVDTANKNGIPWKQTVKELQSNPEVGRVGLQRIPLGVTFLTSCILCQRPKGQPVLSLGE